MIACFLSDISAKYYKNPSMLSRVIAKNVGDVFFETVYIGHVAALCEIMNYLRLIKCRLCISLAEFANNGNEASSLQEETQAVNTSCSCVT